MSKNKPYQLGFHKNEEKKEKQNKKIFTNQNKKNQKRRK